MRIHPKTRRFVQQELLSLPFRGGSIQRTITTDNGMGGETGTWTVIAVNVQYSIAITKPLRFLREGITQIGAVQNIDFYELQLPAATDITEKDRFIDGDNTTYEISLVYRDVGVGPQGDTPINVELCRRCLVVVVK